MHIVVLPKGRLVFGCPTAVIVVEMRQAQLVAVQRHHILAVIVAMLVARIQAEAAGGGVPKGLHHRGKAGLAFQIFKADSHTQMLRQLQEAAVARKADGEILGHRVADAGVDDHYGNVEAGAVAHAIQQREQGGIPLLACPPKGGRLMARGVNGNVLQAALGGGGCNAFGGVSLPRGKEGVKACIFYHPDLLGKGMLRGIA